MTMEAEEVLQCDSSSLTTDEENYKIMEGYI